MPQLGAAIGGLIGGWISPTQVNGPHINDGADQSSQEGQPIPWVLGTCGWLQGNIVDKSKVREVKKTDDGKGSGTEINTFEAHQDFCIMICESSEHRESLMVGVLIVKVDGKIVYDMRPESSFGADNAKFLRNHTFYDGNEAQLPDPTMEALPHNGVGNTPYYRGVFTMVARDINLSQYGERIPVYQFVMVGAGESSSESTISYHAPLYPGFENSEDPRISPPESYKYRCYWVNPSGAQVQSPIFGTKAECDDWFFTETGLIAPELLIGFSANSSGTMGGYTSGTDGSGNKRTVSAAVNQIDPADLVSVIMAYSWESASVYLDVAPDDMCLVASDWTGSWNGSVMKVFPSNPGGLLLFDNCGGSSVAAGYYPYCIQIIRNPLPLTQAPLGDPCLLGQPVSLPDAPGYTQDCEGNIAQQPIWEEVSGSFLALQVQATTTSLGNTFYSKYTLDPIILSSDPSGTQEFWEAAYSDAVAQGKIDSGLVYPTDYPIPIGTATRSTISNNFIEQLGVGLDTVLTRISKRGGLTEDDIDVTEMDQQVLGYMITQSYTGADSIRPLMTAFKSYGSEYDAKLIFHKHGEVIDLVVDPQDIIQGTEESDQTTRDQQVEFPRTYSLTYIDATQDYTARPQVDRRTSSDVRAIGEIQTQVAVVLPPDYARQLANVGMKVNWARAMGSREFSLPYAGYDVYLRAVAGKPFAMDDQRRIASEMSLQDGEIQFKGVYDRQSAYTSDITATPAIPPTPPPSNIGGVTLFAMLNLPVLRDQDDLVGLYFAVAGLLPSWPGALLQVSADDQASWQTAIASMTQASTMGYLTASLPLAPTSGDDITNTLSVSVHGGQLNTIMRLQFLNEGNPCAIVKLGDRAECEVLSFQNANETDPDEYDLTVLARGGLATVPADHGTGARFVALDGVYFWQVPSAWIGRTLWFRAVTFGTAPENNAAYSILFQPAVSQTEWESTYLIGAYGAGSSFNLSVTPRHRLGNDMTPIASSNFIGYQWTATDGTVTQTKETVDPNVVFDLADFPGLVMTYSVSQLNRITGPGPSVSITV
jgi:hypothetical protein